MTREREGGTGIRWVERVNSPCTSTTTICNIYTSHIHIIHTYLCIHYVIKLHYTHHHHVAPQNAFLRASAL